MESFPTKMHLTDILRHVDRKDVSVTTELQNHAGLNQKHENIYTQLYKHSSGNVILMQCYIIKGNSHN